MPKVFPWKVKSHSGTVTKRKFPLLLGHVMTIHKSLEFGFDYMLSDLNRTSKTDKENTVPVVEDLFYTALSYAETCENVRLINFTPDVIELNKPALDEMEKTRNKFLFTWQHPLKEMISNNRMILFNIRSWSAHIKHLLFNITYAECCGIMCFTEAHVDSTSGYTPIDEFIDK